MKAILFDLDGTLLYTLEAIGDSINTVLDRYGLPTHPLEAYKKIIGPPATEMVTMAAPGATEKGYSPEQLLNDYTEVYAAMQKAKTKPYEGIPELLAALVERGIKLAVLTNKRHVATQEVIADFFPNIDFVAVIGARPGIAVKPDPFSALEILEIMGIQAQEAFYVGDSGTDMQTAVAAGMKAVGALWGYRDRKELADGGAELFVEHPLDILALL